MGSYDNIVKTEEIRRRVQDSDFDSAQKIIDTMVLRKIKNIADLGLFADVYIHNERFDEAMELLNRVYKKSKTRRTLYQMVHASIGRRNITEAEAYLKEYEDAAPNDFSLYIFRYKIDKIKKEPYIILIDSLKKLKEYTYMEKWAYELAKLYYKAGMEKECIQECSDLILWFGEGSYVEKAKILKAYYSGEVDKEEIIENLKNRAANMDATADSEGNIIEIKQQDEVENQVLEELSENVGKDVNIFMAEDQDAEGEPQLDKKKPQLDKEKPIDITELISIEDKNEYLEKLEEMSKDLDIDIYQIFGRFLHVKSIAKQLKVSLELIMNKHTKSVQMIITGPPSSGKTTLAKDIAVFLNRTGKLKTSQIAKISAIKLNEIDIINMKEELRNICLVIENASELKKQSIENLLDLIKGLHGEIAVIFEENKKNMNRLFRECPKLMEIFKNRIHLPVYSDDDLLGFAYSYIKLCEYKIHPLALDVLRDGVSNIITNRDSDKRLESVSEYVQKAMTSADLRTGKELPKYAAEGRLADLDILSLIAEDFA